MKMEISELGRSSQVYTISKCNFPVRQADWRLIATSPPITVGLAGEASPNKLSAATPLQNKNSAHAWSLSCNPVFQLRLAGS
ncbi:hypothetical protein CEXT_582661 [Caerostris extrusa]|uniref:Uncharacterized protein n=1 Tax=Caerostris extrusa TaxID=172846 RepID=A0AAV4YGB0_CAEEX|nr:hypothetical protein CEXT_582661 [Caerostris extrusa]